MSKTLLECLPAEFRSSEYNQSRAYRLRDALVVASHDNRVKPWPGPHKNVFVWYVLNNGKAVAWNENPSKGWSFPVISYRE